MKLFLVQTEIFDLLDDCDIPFDNSCYCNIYSSFKLAKEEGVKDLSTRIKDIEKRKATRL